MKERFLLKHLKLQEYVVTFSTEAGEGTQPFQWTNGLFSTCKQHW